MEVFCTSPWVPPEWIKAHGVTPRGIWGARELASEPLPLAAGVCAFADAVVSLARRRQECAVIFTTHCDQLRRGFDAVAEAAASRVFLFNLPVTWQTSVSQRMFSDELKRLGRFLVKLGGHAPGPGELAAAMAQYSQARRRLLEAASWCPARAYAEAIARFHLDGSVNLPPKPAGAERGAHSIPLALVGGPLPQSQMPLLDAIENAGGRVVLNATEAGERSLGTTEPKPWVEADQGVHVSPLTSSLSPSEGERVPFRAGEGVSGGSPTLHRSDRPSKGQAASADQAQENALEVLARTCLANCVDVFQRPNTRLYDWLRPRLVARHARGIVLWHYVGCDLWRAEAQTLRETFGLPVLVLDADETAPQRNTGRLEAFLESLR